MVVSKSGGIGHALKFAQQYPDLVKVVAIIAGGLSPRMMGQEWAKGMAQANAVIPDMGDDELYAYMG